MAMASSATSFGLGMAIATGCFALGSPAWSQTTIPVDVTITPARVDIGEITRVNAGSTAGDRAVAGGGTPVTTTATAGVSAASDNTLTLEACGGVGDLTRVGIENFDRLTRDRESATSASERNRIDRELRAQALRLPGTITEDFSDRQIALGQSAGCDDLVAAVEDLMSEVVDYLGALEDARAGVLW